MYWEVRDMNYRGMMAVSLVVINRMKDDRWPSTACGVIKHYKQEVLTLNLCQFSWYCDGKSDVPHEHEIKHYNFALMIAGAMLDPDCGMDGCIDDFTNGAVLYHSHNVKPDWDYSKTTRTYWDPYHLFYLE